MVELITVVPPIVVGIAIAAWAGVVVRRAVVRTNGSAASE